MAGRKRKRGAGRAAEQDAFLPFLIPGTVDSSDKLGLWCCLAGDVGGNKRGAPAVVAVGCDAGSGAPAVVVAEDGATLVWCWLQAQWRLAACLPHASVVQKADAVTLSGVSMPPCSDSSGFVRFAALASGFSTPPHQRLVLVDVARPDPVSAHARPRRTRRTAAGRKQPAPRAIPHIVAGSIRCLLSTPSHDGARESAEATPAATASTRTGAVAVTVVATHDTNTAIVFAPTRRPRALWCYHMARAWTSVVAVQPLHVPHDLMPTACRIGGLHRAQAADSCVWASFVDVSSLAVVAVAVWVLPSADSVTTAPLPPVHVVVFVHRHSAADAVGVVPSTQLRSPQLQSPCGEPRSTTPASHGARDTPMSTSAGARLSPAGGGSAAAASSHGCEAASSGGGAASTGADSAAAVTGAGGAVASTSAGGAVASTGAGGAVTSTGAGGAVASTGAGGAAASAGASAASTGAGSGGTEASGTGVASRRTPRRTPPRKAERRSGGSGGCDNCGATTAEWWRDGFIGNVPIRLCAACENCGLLPIRTSSPATPASKSGQSSAPSLCALHAVLARDVTGVVPLPGAKPKAAAPSPSSSRVARAPVSLLLRNGTEATAIAVACDRPDGTAITVLAGTQDSTDSPAVLVIAITADGVHLSALRARLPATIRAPLRLHSWRSIDVSHRAVVAASASGVVATWDRATGTQTSVLLDQAVPTDTAKTLRTGVSVAFHPSLPLLATAGGGPAPQLLPSAGNTCSTAAPHAAHSAHVHLYAPQ